MRIWKKSLRLLLFVIAIVAAPVATGQDSTAQATTPSVAEIEAGIAATEANESLDEAIRSEALAAYREALGALEAAAAAREAAAQNRQRVEEAPSLLREIQQELANPPAAPALDDSAGMTLSQMEAALAQASIDLEDSRGREAGFRSAIATTTDRRTSLPGLINSARIALDAVQVPDPASSTEAPEIAIAKRALALATLEQRAAELEQLETELATHDARRDLRLARNDQAQRRVLELQQVVEAWQGEVSARRQIEAQSVAEDARRQSTASASLHPALATYAQETERRASVRAGREGASASIDEIQRKTAGERAQLAALRSQFSAIERRLDASDSNRAAGVMLRRLLGDLPSRTELGQRIRRTQRDLESTEFALIELEDERLETGDIDRVSRTLLASIPAGDASASQEELRSAARELVIARRDLLDGLIADESSKLESLYGLNRTIRDMRRTANAYREYIDERILWVPSHTGALTPTTQRVREAIDWFFDRSAWSAALSATSINARENIFAVSSAFAIFLTLLAFGGRCRRRLDHLAEQVARFRTDSVRHTLEALALTIAIALPAAFLIYAIGWLLEHTPDQPDVATATGYGLRSAALTLAPLAVLLQVVRRNGLGRAHFRWSKEAADALKHELRWAIPALIPLIFAVSTIDRGNSETSREFSGRPMFTLTMIVLFVFLFRILSSRSPVLRQFLQQNQGGLTYRLRVLWRGAILLLPLILIGLSWAGYHYTALQLETKLEQTLALALAFVLIHSVLLRWLFIANRRIAVDDARRRREQAAAEAAESPEGKAPDLPAIEEDKIDLPALSEKTRHLFQTAVFVSVIVGLYVIWAEALPALRAFDRIQVWPSVQVLDASDVNIDAPSPGAPNAGADATADAATSGAISPIPGVTSDSTIGQASTETIANSITIADIGMFIVLIIVTVVAFRNIPSLIEIVVLQRLPMDAGSRYALSTVLRYAIAIVGIIVAFNAIGITWSSVQWLAAALTFGLAFGLQEIFANFISGLIILAERPIRLGDTVTVGNVSGTVTRIRMRATIITDWDRKELVIPNKTFITSDVINWSLSDSVLRVTIPVGVSYSSDVDLVRRLLKEVAAENEQVLESPEPRILFLGFGDSTLDYQMRVFIPSPDNFSLVRHELHTAIIKKFRQHGVEIAFPQRDLHLRTADGLEDLTKNRDDFSSSGFAPGSAD